LKNNDHIDFTQSALVLENLIGQLVANFAKTPGQSDSGQGKANPPATPEKTK